MAKISDFKDLGQAIWSDYLRRSFIDSGEFKRLIDQGLSGVTSNPTIFEKAISGSKDYDRDLKLLTQEEEKPLKEIYESLALEDISRAADLLKPVYDSLKGRDGFVSMEVDPKLANDTRGMVDEALRYFRTLNRPNVMIKIPATGAGFPAIKALTAQGVNVNVTLIFSQEQYERAAKAYISGLEEFVESGGDPRRISSVASFFVSRVDTKVDEALDALDERGKELKGKIGIANAKVAYARFREIFSDPRWKKLESKGAKVQRVLWASTSTKNPSYPDTLYVDNLVGKDTVDTLPPNTIQALLDHGRAQNTLESGLEEARNQLKRLSELGIDFAKTTKELEDEGIEKFDDSLDSLFEKIAQKRERLLSEPYSEPAVGSYKDEIDTALNKLSTDRIVQRIWHHDHTVWKTEPEGITNSLGWLEIASAMEELYQRLNTFVEKARVDGYTDALLLGMGGSSLAAKVFANVFGTKEGYLSLSVLDTTDPAAIASALKGLDLSKTLFIISTKSGKTIETLSLFKFFYNKELEDIRGRSSGGKKQQENNAKGEVGRHFVAITDPGSPLEAIADECSFRAKFLNDQNIGGRYSALSYFGLVPAALMGVDLPLLLDNALTMSASCESSVDINDNPGAWLGAIIGALAKRGIDKLTLSASPEFESLCDWIEQLIAESTGKEGKGILPVVGEELSNPENYGRDRLFVDIRLGSDDARVKQLEDLESSGFPVVRLGLKDRYEIARQFFQWEFATAIAGHMIGINPFDQPNVESSKKLSREVVMTYQEKGTFPPEAPALSSRGMSLFGKKLKVSLDDPASILLDFVDRNKTIGSYICFQAFIEENPETSEALQGIRTSLRDRSKLATTLGYGPRFLHSTGQLHKGDSGLGIFVQFTSEENPKEDLPIPEEAGSAKSSLSFGILKAAEAIGDRKSLEERGRKIIRIGLGKKPGDSLLWLEDAIEKNDARPDERLSTMHEQQQKSKSRGINK